MAVFPCPSTSLMLICNALAGPLGLGMQQLVERLWPWFEGMWSGCRPICSFGLPLLSTMPSDALGFGSSSNNRCDASWAADEEREEDLLSTLCVESALRLAMALSANRLGMV